MTSGPDHDRTMTGDGPDVINQWGRERWADRAACGARGVRLFLHPGRPSRDLRSKGFSLCPTQAEACATEKLWGRGHTPPSLCDPSGPPSATTRTKPSVRETTSTPCPRALRANAPESPRHPKNQCIRERIAAHLPDPMTSSPLGWRAREDPHASGDVSTPRSANAPLNMTGRDREVTNPPPLCDFARSAAALPRRGRRPPAHAAHPRSEPKPSNSQRQRLHPVQGRCARSALKPASECSGP